MVFRDGQWFTALDERYLLPLFSNSVTARRSMAKKGARKASVYTGEGSQSGTPRGGSLDLVREEEGDLESENGKNKVQRTFRWVPFFFPSSPSFLLLLLHSSLIPFDHDLGQ
jgi:sodium/hydrogen exchanger-like protein 6/7